MKMHSVSLSRLVGVALLLVSALANPFEASDALSKRNPRDAFTIECNRERPLIEKELVTAIRMAQAGSRIAASSDFYQALFSEQNRKTLGFEEAVQAKYAKLAQLSNDPKYPVRVTCTPDCKDGIIAWARAGTKMINLCERWFNDQTKAEASFVAEMCGAKSASSKKWDSLSAYKGSKALTLLHEMAHLDYAGGKEDRARDYAYGVKDCLALAAGKHQNPKQCQGTCNPRESFENADTLALVAAGEYWSGTCGKKIALQKRDLCDQRDAKCRRQLE